MALILLSGDNFLIDLIAAKIVWGQLVSDGIPLLLHGEEMKAPRAAAFHKQLSFWESLWGPKKFLTLLFLK